MKSTGQSKPNPVKFFDKLDKSVHVQSLSRDDIVKRIPVSETVITSIRSLPLELNDELFEDLIYDAHDLTNNTFESVYKSVYPQSDIHTSSVLLLHHEHNSSDDCKVVNDAFLQMLQSTYRGTYRNDDKVHNKMRCTLISSDGGTVHAVEFEEERDYWGFVGAVKKQVAGALMDNSLRGRCRYIENSCNVKARNSARLNGEESKSAAAITSTPHRSVNIFGMMTSARDPSAANTALQKFELSNGVVVISDNSGAAVVNIALSGMKALALTVDFERSLDVVLEVSLEPTKTTSVPTSDSTAATVSKAVLAPFHLELQGRDEEEEELLPGDHSPSERRKTTPASEVLLPVSRSEESSPLCMAVPISKSDITQLQVSSPRTSVPRNRRVVAAVNQEPQRSAADYQIAIFGTKDRSAVVAKQPLPLALFLHHEAAGMSSPSDRLSVDRQSLDGAVTADSLEASPNISGQTRNKSNSMSFYRPFARSPSNPNLTVAVGPPDHMSSPKKTPQLSSLDTPRQQQTISSTHVVDSVKFNQPVFCEVQLQQKALNRAARVFIKMAQEIPSTYPKNRVPLPPTAYCTAYLMGPTGEKLSTNHAEARTEAVKSFSPEWRKEILLQDNAVPVEQVSGVMILVRDAASGLLKHHHIGQVTIPIGCFLYQTEADFCLPLEPTYRMREDVQQRSYIGDLHLTTQLVDVEDCGPVSKDSALKVSAPSVAHTAYLRYTLRSAAPTSTWWPMKTLLVGNTTSVSRLGGHVLCSFGELRIRLAVGAVGLLMNSKECSEGTLRLPWENVNSVVDVTDSVLLLTVSFHSCISNPGQMARGELIYGPAVIDLLVGPCPAAKLCDCVAQRISSVDPRKKLAKLSLSITEMRLMGNKSAMPSPSRNRGLSFAAPSSQQSPTRLHKSLSFAGFPDLLPNIQQLASAVGDMVRAAEEGLLLIEEQQEAVRNKQTAPHSNGYGAISISTAKTAASSTHAAESGRQKVNLVHALARAKLYFGVLRQLCRDYAAADPNNGELPLFTLSAVRQSIDQDVQDTQLFTPLRENAKPETLQLRHNSFVELAVARIRDYILFSASATGSRECIEKLVEGYLATFRQSLLPYIGSKEVFTQLAGQEIKNCVVRLLVENNLRFHDDVSALLMSVLDLRVTPRLVLTDSMDSVIRWYGATLLTETKRWLSKTLLQAANNRTNSCDLPWDVEQVGDRFASHLPETLRFQMNVYIDLCAKQAIAPLAGSSRGNNNNDDNNASSADGAKGENYSSKDLLYLKINGKIVEAVGLALVSLGDEYQRALQSKHWDQGDKSTGVSAAYRSFLVAVLNDSFRVQSKHVVETVGRIQTVGTLSADVGGSVAGTFQRVSRLSSLYLVRIVFSDVQATLLDFEQLWETPLNGMARSMATNFNHHFNFLRNNLEEQHFVYIAAACAKVVSIRLLLFLKERAVQAKEALSAPNKAGHHETKAFTVEEVTRFVDDVHVIKRSFDDAIDREEELLQSSALDDTAVPSSQRDPSVAEQLACLDEACSLLTLYRDSDQFLQAVRAVAGRHSGGHEHVAESFLLQCICVLRPDADASLLSSVHSALTASAAKATSGKVHACDDALLRVFGSSTPNNNGVEDGGALDHALDHGADTAARRPSNTAGGKGLLNLFTSPRTKAATTSGSAAGNALKTLNPVSALKHLREKVADSAVKNSSRRRNEEYAVHLMRLLGLEVDPYSSEDPRPAADGRNGNDLSAALQDEEVENNSSDSDPDSDDENGAGRANKRNSLSKAAMAALKGGASSADEDKYIVQIRGLQVRGLQSSSLFGRANPYVKLSLGEHKVKSSVKHNCAEAVWKESLELRTSFNKLGAQKLTVRVFDKERIRRKRLLGAVVVKLTGLEMHDISSWYALEGGETGSTGDVYISLTIPNRG